MQLYRIEYDQLTHVSKFDAKGNLLERVEERVRVSMNDLPLPTAIMYREKMQGLNFKMAPQEIARETPRTNRQHKTFERTEKRAVSNAPAAPTREQKVKEAAKAGDMTAAINMRSK